jgi:hypothetical protein
MLWLRVVEEATLNALAAQSRVDEDLFDSGAEVCVTSGLDESTINPIDPGDTDALQTTKSRSSLLRGLPLERRTQWGDSAEGFPPVRGGSRSALLLCRWRLHPDAAAFQRYFVF